jgi:uncharacterized protein (TIGR02118 family)
MSKPVKLIALLKARPGMSRSEFERYWIEEHAHLNLKLKNLRGYRVNIALEDYQDVEDLPYDGTAELWWDSIEEMEEDFKSAEGKFAGADADSFTSLRMHIYTREHVVK